MLTKEQKRDIISFISTFSTKPIFECVNSVGDAYNELDYEPDDDCRDKLWDEVTEFLDDCGSALEDWFENEHCKHLDG